jgi:hypothetical protein
MPDMTEEEYDALDELRTKTTPKVGPQRDRLFKPQGSPANGHGHPFNQLSNDQSGSRPQTPRPNSRRNGMGTHRRRHVTQAQTPFSPKIAKFTQFQGWLLFFVSPGLIKRLYRLFAW